MKTQKQLILDHLREEGPITAMIAAQQYGIMRLAARIYELRKMGFIIKTDMRFRGSKHWASYKLRHEPAEPPY